MLKVYEIFKVSMVVLYVLTCLLLGIFMFLQFYDIQHGESKLAYSEATRQTYCMFFELLLQIVTGFVILYAVFAIHSFIKKGLRISSLNERNLLWHAAAFVLYTIALIVETVFAL